MDINCDLGEGESATKTRSLMQWITSANIASGGHAGDEKTIRRTLRLCREFDVNAGAHPGFEDFANFGRVAQSITAGELKQLLIRQVVWLATLAEEEGVPLAHIKLHGALYHVVETDTALARAYVSFAKGQCPGVRLLVSPQGAVREAADKQGVEAWPEIYADRAYQSDGTLSPRKNPRALLSLTDIRHRLEAYRILGLLFASDGTPLDLDARTVCIHSDSPGAVRVARLLATQ